MRNLKKIATLFATAALSCAALTACGGSRELNLNDYVTVSVTGYDGYGTVAVDFDEAAFEKDCEGIKFKNKVAEESFGSVADYYDTIISYTVTGNGTLVNGDTATLVWNVDKSIAENNTSGTLKYENIECKVEGLESAPTIDIFEPVKFEVSETVNGGYNVALKKRDSSETGISGAYGLPEFQYCIYKADSYDETKKSEKSGPNKASLSSGTKEFVVVAVLKNGTIDAIIETYGGMPETTVKTYNIDDVLASMAQ